jgi:hypothetical protein
MGATAHTLSLKLYQDSTKALMVAFTAYFGKDTVIDTSRANFNDAMGEVQMALPLPKNGPDAGKSLLLRGRYESIQSLLMGPVDMIMTPAKTSVNFGSGPYVGQFAASGRGEDVSRYLPGAGGPTGPIVNNPINNPPMSVGYRQPPAGTNEGALISFAGGKLRLIDDFGDTLVTYDMVNWRSQPDGSYELFAEKRVTFPNGMRRFETGGRVMLAGSDWVIEGHFMVNFDSAGIHKDIPGQLCAKAAKDQLKPIAGAPGLEGTLKGWIFQDKLGGGFVGPVTNPQNPTCPAGQVCNDPNACPPGMTCGPVGPVNSFNAPLMGSVEKIIDFEKNVVGADSGLVIHVSMNGRIYVADLDDSTETMNAKWPLCGQVVTKLNLIPLDEGATDEMKKMHMEDSIMLSRMPSTNVNVFIEAQGNPGRPALLDKARTANGDIVTQVYVVESRPTPMEYGKEGMSCGLVGGPNPNPCPVGTICPNPNPCPVGTVCPNPNPNPNPVGPMPFFTGTVEIVKTALERSGNSVLLKKDSASTGEKLTLDLASLKRDDMRNAVIGSIMGQPTMMVVFLGVDGGANLALKDNVPVVGPYMQQTNPCPAGQTCPNPNPNQGQRLFLQAEVSSVQAALATTQNTVYVLRDSAGTLMDAGKLLVDPTQLRIDTGMKAIIANELGKPDNKVAFLAEGDVKTPKTRDGMAVTLKLMGPPPGGQTCPVGQTCPQPQPISGDTTKPVVYKGTLENLQAVLAKSNGMVELIQPPPSLPMAASIESGSLKQEVDIFTAHEVGNPTRVFVFMGQKANQTLPMTNAQGRPIVTLKPAVAGTP